MPHDAPVPLRLWDDNPTFFDLLGFDAVVEPILEALRTPDLDPLTVGVQSPWGGGKSTVLNLLDNRLFNNPGIVVVRTDPWEYDNQADVSGALIAEILDGLRQKFAEDAQVTEKAKELLDRISWSRIGLALGRGCSRCSGTWKPPWKPSGPASGPHPSRWGASVRRSGS